MRLSSVAHDDLSDEDMVEEEASEADFDESADRSIKEISRPAIQAPKRRRASEYDESLVVELPSFASFSRIPRTHPTARTVSSEQFEPAKATPKQSKRHSKFFSPKRPSPSELVPESGSESGDSPDRSAKWSKPNPFASTREDTEKRKILPEGIRPAAAFKSAQTRKEPIEVTSSPETRPPLKTTGLNGARPAVASGLRGVKSGLAKQPSMIDFLGLADKQGRPVKTLASGAKIRRRV
jgi:hypothetical protein